MMIQYQHLILDKIKKSFITTIKHVLFQLTYNFNHKVHYGIITFHIQDKKNDFITLSRLKI